MRRAALAALAAALLGACAVDVDGAPCAVPGATTDCPGGQACGNDLRCSARALACAASRCTPGAGGACLDPAGVGTGTAVARWCDARDPVCGVWTEDPCAGRGWVCGVRSGSPRCECPEADARELAVRADGAPADRLPYATGASAPAGCAFATLGDALARARVLRGLDPTTVVTVTAAGAPAGTTRTFSEAAGEPSFPIAVDRGIALRSDARSGGGTYEILQDHPGGSTAVELHAGGTLDGFTIRNVTGGAAHDGLLLRCDGRVDPALVSSVELDGAGGAGATFGVGIHGVEGCPLSLADVRVRSVGVGIGWTPATPGALTVRGGSVTACAGAGVVVGPGARALLDGVRVAGNAGRGVDAPGGSVELRRARIVRNGDTGVALAAAPEVRISETTLWGNGAVTAWTGPASGIARRAGGLVLSGAPPAGGGLELWGNRIYANGGDQVLVLGPQGAKWALDHQALDPTTCLDGLGHPSNLVGCFDPEPAGTTGASHGIAAIDVAASAVNQWWSDGVAPTEGDAACLPPSKYGLDVTSVCLSSTPALACGSEEPPP